MVSGISNVNSLDLLRASRAFKTASKPAQIFEDNNSEEIEDVALIESLKKEIKTDLNNSSDNIEGKNLKINEIKEFTQNIGGMDVSDEDIKYGLTYGRSVLVDYSA
jgi:hypothetical protein